LALATCRGQARLPHQALYPLAIDSVARLIEEYNHPAAAIGRAPCVLLVDQATEQQTREAELPVSLVPWVEFGMLIEPHNPKAGNDCPAIGVERMLRMFYAVD
jgi:hypothetical protein